MKTKKIYFKMREDLNELTLYKRDGAISHEDKFKPTLFEGIERPSGYIRVTRPFTYKGYLVNRIDVDFLTIKEVLEECI